MAAILLALSVTFSSGFANGSGLFPFDFRKVITMRTPFHLEVPHQCHVIFLVHLESTLIMTPDQLQSFSTVELLDSESMGRHSILAPTLKLSAICLHLILSATDTLKEELNRKWIDNHILNYKQSVAHFVFVGPEEEVTRLASTDTYEQIKHKTSITTDTQSVLVGDNRNYFFVRGTEHIPKLLSEGEMLRNRKLNCLLWKLEPYTLFDAHGRIFGGFNYRHAEAICNMYNSSCNYVIDWGPLKKLPNGTWLGFMGELANPDGVGDIMFGLAQTEERYGAAEFAVPTVYYEVKFFTAPARASVDWKAIVYPFHLDVWLALIVVILLCSMIYCAQFMSGRKRHVTNRSKAESLLKAWEIPFAVLLLQSVKIPSEAKSLTLFAMFFAILMGTAYNSNLVSHLTFPEQERLPTTFQELAEMRHRYRVAVTHNPGAIMSDYFLYSNNTDARLIREVINYERNWEKCTVPAVTSFQTACVSVTFTMEMYAAKNFTLHEQHVPYVESKTTAMSTPVQVGVRWTSRYTTVVNRITGLLMATGHIEQWKKESLAYIYRRGRPWMKTQVGDNSSSIVRSLRKVLEETEAGHLRPFGMKNFLLAFVILTGGSVIAGFGWVAEKLISLQRG